MNHKIEQMGDLLFEVTKNLKKITEKSLKDYGVGIGQLQVLLMFYKDPSQFLTQNDLVIELKVDKGNISRNVAKLLEKGFIELTENNGRHYILTQAGITLKGEVLKFFVDTHQKMIDGISEDELMTTFACLLRINQNLEVI